ncbi:hypothetical protein [Weissella confusa]|nr:hypothetical protein [Weissella confusa]
MNQEQKNLIDSFLDFLYDYHDEEYGNEIIAEFNEHFGVYKH